MRINDVIMAKASKDVVTVHPDASVRDLVAQLAEHNVGALVVSSDEVTVDGIVSERDVVRQLHLDPGVLDASVSSIMTNEVHTCSAADLLDDMMTLMTNQRVRHVPVVEDGRLTGIVSIGDVVKHKISALQFERDQLDSYVHQT
jgi:CBS domain-containing protein